MSTTRIPVERRLCDDRYVVRAELPGVDPRSLRVTYRGGELRLEAVREPTIRPLPIHSEFRYGTLFRVIPIPPGVKSRSLRARYANGILEVAGHMGAIEACGFPLTVPVEASDTDRTGFAQPGPRSRLRNATVRPGSR